MSTKFSFNYLYFGFLFFLLFFLQIFSLPFSKGGFFFLGESLCQTMISVLVLITITFWIEKKCSFFYKAWVVLLFFLPLVYIVDFFLLSLMDAPLSHGINIFLGQGVGKLFLSLRAANINTPILLLIATALFSLPFIALWVERFTKRFTQKRPFHLSFSLVCKLAGVFFSFLLFFDLAITATLLPSFHNRYQHRLPWGTNLFSPHPLASISFSSSLKPIECHKLLPHYKKQTTPLPNIYLFIVESLRKDAIDAKTAPSLFSFQKENLALPLTYSSANFSPISWFSIFHSIFPFYWREYREQNGSLPLALLKQLGYKIHLFSSAELEYFLMDTSIFGKGHELADHYCAIEQSIEVCERDRTAVSLLKNAISLEENREGNCFIIFLDSTHSEYSCPKNFPTRFAPMAATIPYLFLVQSRSSLLAVKNRYYNALSYVDSLFGSFLEHLKEKNLYNSSIIVFTADHGEEFFEEEALFHGTHLNNPQTRIPIFYHFPHHHLKVQTEMTSHIDIFPTLLHFLTQDLSFSSFFDGVSLFAPHPWPYILTVHQNGGEAPYFLSLLNAKGRLIGKLQKKIFQARQFEIISVKNLEDQEIETSSPAFQEVSSYFSNAFDPLLQKK